jgi:hypothetical protein
MRNHEDIRFSKDDLDPILRQYHVPYPDESEIERTVESLRAYVPSKRHTLHIANLKKLLYDTAICLNFTSISFWVISALIYGIGCVLTLSIQMDAYKTMLILAPLPFVFSLLEAFRGREEGVLELELACKITPQEVIVSKILVAGAYNAILNGCLSLIFSFTEPSVLLGKITLFWLLPMLLTGGVALWLCSRIKSVYAVPATLSCWLASAAAIATQEQIFTMLLSLNGWVLITLLVAAIGLFIKEIFTLKKRYCMDQEVAIWN